MQGNASRIMLALVMAVAAAGGVFLALEQQALRQGGDDVATSGNASSFARRLPQKAESQARADEAVGADVRVSQVRAVATDARVSKADGEKIVAAAAASATATAADASNDMAALSAEAQGLIKRFATRLKGRLKAALKADGPAAAIAVCQSAAPEITDEVSEQAAGWTVARTALKLRNPGNEPDAYELKVLQAFERQKAQGADPKKLVHKAIVSEEGKRLFRFIKAIPTGKLCLTCHGSNLAPEVQKKLNELYEDDKATGFKAGDIRGAFTLTKVLQ